MKTLIKMVIASALFLGVNQAARAQVLLGGFQSAYDITDPGWVNQKTQNPITSDSACSFVAAGVPGCPQSLEITGTNGVFESDSLQLFFTPEQIAAFNTNSWVTFIFSVPAWTNSGYSQIYYLGFNAPGYGYHNLSWTNAQEMGYTADDTAGSHPNFYFYDGSPMRTQTVTVNYSSVTNAIIAGGEAYLYMYLQGNPGVGAPPYIFINNVTLSRTPFEIISNYANTFVLDDFSSNGVSYLNPPNDDYGSGDNIYADGQITNVWRYSFGSAFSNLLWAGSVDANSNPASGSLEIQLDWTRGSQFAVLNFNFYGANMSSITYTDFECDVKYAAGSACGMGGSDTFTNFGRLRFGLNSQPYWIASTNIPASNTNWVHISVPLSRTDPNLLNISQVYIGEDSSVDGSFLNGPSTLYVDNIKFTGPENAPPLTGTPAMGMQTARPGLRIFGGDYVSQNARQQLATVDDNQSWISPIRYPVTYSFTLLSYPDKINQTHIFLIPGAGSPYGGDSFVDYEASNALWLDIQPAGNGGVTASVLWKTNAPNSNPTNRAVSFTNPTAIGKWTLTFNSPNSGTVTAPRNSPVSFIIADPKVSSDFANPLVAYFGLQANSAAGEGEYEDWGSISVLNVSGTNESEDFTTESSDFNYRLTPSGEFTSDSAEDPAGLIIVVTNSDKYWVDWTYPALNAFLVANTNLSSNPTNWISPSYYSQYYYYGGPPRDSPQQIGARYWNLLPMSTLPTANGGYQQNPPDINDPLAPIVYFMLSTNFDEAFPYPP